MTTEEIPSHYIILQLERDNLIGEVFLYHSILIIRECV